MSEHEKEVMPPDTKRTHTATTPLADEAPGAIAEWTQERRERLEAAPLHVKGCPLAHAPNRFASCACGLDIFAALSEIDRLTARVEAVPADVAALVEEARAVRDVDLEEGEFDVLGLLGRLADALQSPRPPSESDVEAIARILREHRWSPTSDGHYDPLPAARAILSHLTPRPPSEDAAARITENDIARIISGGLQPEYEDFNKARDILAYIKRQLYGDEQA